MSDKEFLQPHLRGPRFEEGTIPLDILKDLSVLGEMVTEVAKWSFLKDHPDRARSPRGFTDGIEFKLVGLKKGSAVPMINLTSTVESPRFLDVWKYLEKARDAIVNAIAAAEQELLVEEHLPEKCLIYFDRIGRSLREGEAIEFPTPSQTTPARLTKETRRRLILRSSRIQELTEEVGLRGSIPAVDQDRMTFQLQLANGHRIAGPVPVQHLDAIIEAFNGYRDASRVLIRGIGKYDRQECLVGLESIEQISVLDQLDVPACLEELRELKNGWLDGEGLAPDHNALDWLAKSFDKHYPDDLPLPHVYPTPEGGVQVEWSLPPSEISLDIDIANQRGQWHELNLNTDKEKEKMLNLAERDDWSWLADEMRALSRDSE